MTDGEQGLHAKAAVSRFTIGDALKADKAARSLMGQLKAARFETDVQRHLNDPSVDDLVEISRNRLGLS